MSIAEDARGHRRAKKPGQVLPDWSALDKPLAPLHPDQILTFHEWCRLNCISVRTGRRILASGNGPVVTQLSPQRVGISVKNKPAGKRRRHGGVRETQRPGVGSAEPRLETSSGPKPCCPSENAKLIKPNGPVATDWRAPTELPDLRRVGNISLDTETNDEGLRADRGSAWAWRGGYICGISVACHADSETRAHYLPLCHPDSENFPRENVARWLRDHIAAGVKFITQNGLYHWGWLRTNLGITLPSSDQLEEIGALVTLINENLFNDGLDALCAWQGLPGKDETLLRQAAKAAGFKHQEEPTTIIHLAIAASPSCRSSLMPMSAWTKSLQKNGWCEPLTASAPCWSLRRG